MSRSAGFLIALLVALGAPANAGVSWKAIWLEPFDIHLAAGHARPYVIKGIRLGDVEVDITQAPNVKISSEDPAILSVEEETHSLIARKVGHTQVRIAFDQITAYYDAWVMPESPK